MSMDLHVEDSDDLLELSSPYTVPWEDVLEVEQCTAAVLGDELTEGLPDSL